MPTYRYVAEAAIALHAYVQAGIVAQLRLVEIAYDESSGYLPDPIAVLDYPAPLDNRSPLVRVFEDGMRPENVGGQRNGIWTVPCTIVWSYKGDADLSKSQRIRRGWYEALIRLLVADPQAASTPVHVLIREGALLYTEGDDSATRLLFSQTVDVVVEG